MADASKQGTQAQDENRKGDEANALKPVLKSRSKYVREGWGSWPNFMGSYLLKLGNEDDEDEGNRILDALRQAEFEAEMEKYREQLQRDGKQ